MPVLHVGDVVAARRLDAIDGTEVPVPDPTRLVHLQFRRFAGCPICHLHLRSVARRHDEIRAAGVVEVAVFHSAADALRKHQSDLPFGVVADPERVLYREFGVGSSPASIAHPRAWLAAVRGTRQQRSPTAGMGRGEDHFGLPADFLIGPDGALLAVKYGKHADDQWSVDDIIAVASRHGPPG
ncbi:AhpC/TSA family protein [Mycobacterium sp. Y57]|uniref:peroxiredoxin-like family protein n=1 Tax=Mycolicibacterium xanthum TaxID=2796469 RepID=UPI001C8622E8|nr:peroxiredoxin-like family protein [Mycolicibacterium xanthum]MBX7434002.1 AhpC/TSA family protein [Mycolicibacterium xanthum]